MYRLAQFVLAPGAETGLRRVCAPLLDAIPDGALYLDVGCGPRSRLARGGRSVVGTDVSLPYMRTWKRAGGMAVASDATRLPFAGGSFESVWCFGLLHHLDDTAAKQTVTECRRVAKPGGSVVVLDAVYPRSALLRPIPYLLRRFDRGAHVRTQAQMREIIAPLGPCQELRRTYALNGLELMMYARSI